MIENKNKREWGSFMNKKVFAFCLCIVMMLQGCAGRETKQDAVATPTNTISPEEEKYQKAEQYYKEENYEDAAILFQELGSYNDSSIRYKDTLLLQAKKRYEAGEYTNVIKMLSNLDSEKASELIRQCYAKLGEKMFDRKKYKKAIAYYEKLDSKDAEKKIKECKYQLAIKSFKDKKYKEAKKTFEKLGSYQEAEQYVKKCSAILQKAEEFFTIEYAVNQARNDAEGKMYKNGSGVLKFGMDVPDEGWTGMEGGGYVTYTVPSSSIHFRLVNNGNVALVNPIVKFEFTGVILNPSCIYEPFVAENHAHGIGGYGTAALYCSDNLQPGATSVDYMLYLSESYFTNGATGTLKISLSADNYKARTYTVPLKLGNE